MSGEQRGSLAEAWALEDRFGALAGSAVGKVRSRKEAQKSSELPYRFAKVLCDTLNKRVSSSRSQLEQDIAKIVSDATSRVPTSARRASKKRSFTTMYDRLLAKLALQTKAERPSGGEVLSLPKRKRDVHYYGGVKPHVYSFAGGEVIVAVDSGCRSTKTPFFVRIDQTGIPRMVRLLPKVKQP